MADRISITAVHEDDVWRVPDRIDLAGAYDELTGALAKRLLEKERL